MKVHPALFLILAFVPPPAPAQVPAPPPDIPRCMERLKHFAAGWDSVKDVHPFFNKLYPVAVVEKGHYLIFDVDASGKAYVFIKSAPAPDTLPNGIRAAFPLDAYDGRMTAVVSPDSFDTAEGFVLILHEFIHCAQWDCCEAALKEKLGIARKAEEKRDFMWELQYPFPYGSAKVTDAYLAFIKAALGGDTEAVDSTRRRLRRILKKSEFEYMAWEEYKEGFARHVENLIRVKLGLRENAFGREKPLTRVSFYSGGAAYIAHVCGKEPALCSDPPRLFSKIMEPIQGGRPR